MLSIILEPRVLHRTIYSKGHIIILVEPY